MTIASIVQLVLVTSIALSVLALALRAHPQDITYLIRHWRRGAKAFIAMFVVVPVVAVIVALVVDPPAPVKIAIIALAFSPTPPVLPKSQMKAGGHADYVTSLLVFASIASLLIAPAGIMLASQFFPADARIGLLATVPILIMTIGGPLLLGFGGRALFGEAVIKPARIIGLVSGITLAIGVLVLLVLLAPSIWQLVGHGTLLALLVMIASGVAAGYALGGPDNRTSLALASATRHPGAASAIAVAAFPDEHLAVAACWLALVLSSIIAAPLAARLHKAEPET